MSEYRPEGFGAERVVWVVTFEADASNGLVGVATTLDLGKQMGDKWIVQVYDIGPNDRCLPWMESVAVMENSSGAVVSSERDQERWLRKIGWFDDGNDTLDPDDEIDVCVTLMVVDGWRKWHRPTDGPILAGGRAIYNDRGTIVRVKE